MNKIDFYILSHKYYGRINDSIVSTYLKGPCGDEMEIYFDVIEEKISDIKVFTTGCEHTKIFGIIMASIADNKTIYEAMNISAGEIINSCPDLHKNNIHCGILAASVLYKAIATYLLNYK